MKWLWLALLVGGFQSVNADTLTGRYKQIVDQLRAIHARHPASTKVFSIGENDDGNEIYAMRISVHPEAIDNSKIGHLVVGTHHGNESHAATFTVRFIERILQTVESDELFRSNTADIEWTIVPVLNIPGYNANQRYERNQDPNRDYPGPCINVTQPRLKSIRTLMSFLTQRIFSGSLTVHGYIGTLTYPWGVDISEVKSNDHNFFEQITRKAAEKNGYRYGTSTDIVYPADGTYEDYAYWKHGMWSLLLELKNGSDADLTSTVTAMSAYFDQLVASPSIKNQLTGHCKRTPGLRDLRID